MFRKASAEPTPARVSGRSSRTSAALPAFLAGSAFGFLIASVVTARPVRDSEEAAVRTLAGGWAQLAGAWQEMLDTWMAAMERAPGPVDLEALTERLRTLPGGEAVTVRLLDSGIVEVTGNLPAEDRARTLLDAVAEEAGVKVVLNRIWLDESAPPGTESPDASAPDDNS